MLSRALHALGLPYAFKHWSALLASPQSTCPEGSASQVSMHIDLMFKVRRPWPTLPMSAKSCLCVGNSRNDVCSYH